MGREFNDLFDEWSQSYDDTVAGSDPQYADVFLHYNSILDQVAERATGNVIEFGVGTGNLTEKLLSRGLRVFGIEPSEGMRKIANEKMPGLHVQDGDFLTLPALPDEIDSIVSTYAFHHLTDKEKGEAIRLYSDLLHKDGRIIFGDTIFATDKAKMEMIAQAKRKKYGRLAADLLREYYTTIPIMQNIFNRNGFEVSFTKCNPFVWIMDARKSTN
ncbi:class I SAM-dependent methyltransferase [Virgibacillus sp. 179-BFC.A HS]|uniref:Uncharacterized methyltransferase P5G51_017615 n=1 Tax=Tigheibacillus jepli TaxID=3035914 RepID=A0ABU5CKR9_9BACI|nr:class I SAM-dependent methyltransferase [Virgibacillus sp. 179-BFC.A HS]MDY0406914.1 class I SAM-dependent methyltransferase [Virgibacillus sp. 179-BFC.A HS]